MPGKTISAYTDEETARLVAELARIEHRKASQIAAAALSFYVRLPPQAHEALRHLAAMGSSEEMNLMLREVTRVLIRSAYDASLRALGPRLQEIYGDTLQTEEDIEAEAVRLMKRHLPEVRRHEAHRSAKVADTETRSQSAQSR
jgi:hypothetical protein